MELSAGLLLILLVAAAARNAPILKDASSLPLVTADGLPRHKNLPLFEIFHPEMVKQNRLHLNNDKEIVENQDSNGVKQESASDKKQELSNVEDVVESVSPLEGMGYEGQEHIKNEGMSRVKRSWYALHYNYCPPDSVYHVASGYCLPIDTQYDELMKDFFEEYDY